MKIGTLIASVIILVGVILQTMVVIIASTSSMSWYAFQDYVSITGMVPPEILPLLGYTIYYFGLMFAFLTAVTAPKILLKIGGILGFLGILGLLSLWLFGGVYRFPSYQIISGFFVLCYLVYFIGLILHRKYNKIAIITGVLVLLAILVANVFFPIYLRTFYEVYNNPMTTNSAQSMANIHLFVQLGLGVLFFIHNLVFSFSKKKHWMDDGAEDTLSVEKGAAFASYVPKDTKEKKPAKGKKDQEVTFKF